MSGDLDRDGEKCLTEGPLEKYQYEKKINKQSRKHRSAREIMKKIEFKERKIIIVSAVSVSVSVSPMLWSEHN